MRGRGDSRLSPSAVKERHPYPTDGQQSKPQPPQHLS
jgi:hypothetical protein